MSSLVRRTTRAPIAQPDTGHLFVGDGAIVNRLADRVFIGGAVANDGAYPNAAKDWLSTFQLAQAGYVNSTGSSVGTQVVALTNDGTGAAFLAGARNSPLGAGAYAIGGLTFAINNGAANAQAFGLYTEAHRMSNTVGGAVCYEVDAVQRGSLQQMTPYALAGGEAVGFKAAAGAELSATGQYDCTAAYVVGSNPMKWDKGIVVMANAISGADGNTGTGYAVNLAKGHLVQWWALGGVPTAALYSTATTSAGAGKLVFEEGRTLLQAGSAVHCYFRHTAGAVNNLALYNAAAGNPVALAAEGSDADIDFQLIPKGTGLVKFGTYAAKGAEVFTGYISVRDANTGTLRKLMVCG